MFQSLENLLYNQKDLPKLVPLPLVQRWSYRRDIKLALSYQFIPVSLGPLILRTETAAIYTLGIVMHFLG